MSTVIVVPSSKGGCGKTTVSHMLVTAAARKRSLLTVAIDLCPTRGLSRSLRLDEDQAPSVADVLLGSASLDETLVPVRFDKAPGVLAVVPGSRQMNAFSVSMASLGALIARARAIADLVVVDVQCLEFAIAVPMRLADRIVIPSTLATNALLQAGITAGIADHYGLLHRVVGLVLTDVPTDPAQIDRDVIDYFVTESSIGLRTVIPSMRVIGRAVDGVRSLDPRALAVADALLEEVRTRPGLDPDSAYVRNWVEPLETGRPDFGLASEQRA